MSETYCCQCWEPIPRGAVIYHVRAIPETLDVLAHAPTIVRRGYDTCFCSNAHADEWVKELVAELNGG